VPTFGTPETNIDIAKDTRLARVIAAFDALDHDRDGALNLLELRRFAECSGFEGTDAEWAVEYERLCDEVGAEPEVGICFNIFMGLVDEDSDNGQYCTDDELLDMIKMAVGAEVRVETAGFLCPVPEDRTFPALLQDGIDAWGYGPNSIPELFATVASQREGLISYRDFLNMLDGFGIDSFGEGAQRFFRVLDSSGTGFVSPAQFRSTVYHESPPFAGSSDQVS